MNHRNVSALFGCLVLVLGGCTTQQARTLDETEARLNEGRLFAFADEHLSDAALAAAVPGGFEFTGVNRNGFERHRKKWITVGVRMEGPVRFARAIFYVHPEGDSAHAEFQRQVEANNWAPNWRGNPLGKSWSDDRLDIPTFCSAQGNRLFWCHAYKGRVHLVIQSSAGWPIRRKATQGERRAMETLLQAFGTYLQEEIPEE